MRITLHRSRQYVTYVGNIYARWRKQDKPLSPSLSLSLLLPLLTLITILLCLHSRAFARVPSRIRGESDFANGECAAWWKKGHALRPCHCYSRVARRIEEKITDRCEHERCRDAGHGNWKRRIALLHLRSFASKVIRLMINFDSTCQ